MSDAPYAVFRRGDRPDDVFVFLSDAAIEDAPVTPGTGVELRGGRGYVLQGTRGRASFADATNVDVMSLAREAMGTEGAVDPALDRGRCPACGTRGTPRFLFAFAEGQNEDAGGRYAEGTVMHAYARCTCGADYSDRWVLDGRAGDDREG